MSLVKNIFCFFILLSFVAIKCCFAATLDTEVSSDHISSDDTITLTFTLSGSSEKVNPDFSPLRENFDIVNTNYGNSIKIINGDTSIQSFWQMVIVPKKTGTITIPEIVFGELKSSPRQITVTEANTITKNNDNAKTFVTAEINNESPYVQGEVLYTLKLYYQSLLDAPTLEMPDIKDAAVIQLDATKQYQTHIQGNPYNVVEKHFLFFPQKIGTLNIPPTRLSAITYDGNGLNDPFSIARPTRISTATKAVNLNVKSVPLSFKGKIWLPAKNIEINETWSNDQTNWTLNTPVTRIITLKAHGLRSDQLPDLVIDQISGMKVYVDQAKRSNRIENNSVVGTLQQKITYIPNTAQSFYIPEITLNWWNTNTETNEVIKLNSLNVIVPSPVTPSNANIQQNIQSSNSIQKTNDVSKKLSINKDISPIKKDTNVNFTNLWFWIALFLLACWLVSLYFMFRQKRKKTAVSLEIHKYVKEEMSEKAFFSACENGDANRAQQFLLWWGRKEWGNITSLNSLRSVIQDAYFESALQNLENALYSKQSIKWAGEDLMRAYKLIKKKINTKSHQSSNKKEYDPLPPLYIR